MTAVGLFGECCEPAGRSVVKVTANSTSIPNTDTYTVLTLAASATIAKGVDLELVAASNAVKVKRDGVYRLTTLFIAVTGTGAAAQIRARGGRNSNPVDSVADVAGTGASATFEGGGGTVVECAVGDLLVVGASHLNGTGAGSCSGILMVEGPIWA